MCLCGVGVRGFKVFQAQLGANNKIPKNPRHYFRIQSSILKTAKTELSSRPFQFKEKDILVDQEVQDMTRKNAIKK